MDVSVIITAYNKGLYIKDCLLGVLDQDFQGDFEVIIANDCSTDNTYEEINSLRKHPNFAKVKYTKHSKNKGLMGNFIWAINQAKGKYLAFCDADDYWTDISKLSFQMNIISANQGLSMVGSLMEFKDSRNQEVLSYDAKYIENLAQGILPKASFYDVSKVPFHISSFICLNSNNIKGKLEKFRFISVSNDIVLWCLLTDIGDCYLCPKVVGIENHVINGITQVQNHLSLNYRLNKVVMWKTLSKKLKGKKLKNLAQRNYLNLYRDLNKRLINVDLQFLINTLSTTNYSFEIWFLIIGTWLRIKLSRQIFQASI